MFSDIKTVIWKEARVLFRGRSTKSNYFRQMFAPVILATVFPITWGPDWVSDIPALIIAFITPAVIVGVMIPDSFAGERERHTLNTLLASRLPDKTIVLGKMLLPILVGVGGALGLSLVSLIVVNIVHGEGSVLLYTLPITWGIFSLSILSSLLLASGGVLISFGASTAQEATQKLMMFVIVPAMVIQVVPLLFRDQVYELIKNLEGYQVLALFCGVLFVMDVILFILALKRFKRSQLIFD